jgi:hypothetical protein
MAKFSEQQTAIESVFASSEWLSSVAGTVKVLPGNFQGAVSETEFLRLEILPARIRADYRNLGTAGQVPDSHSLEANTLSIAVCCSENFAMLTSYSSNL